MTRSVALTFVVRASRIGLGLLASIISARALGPSGRGDYYFAVTFAGAVVQFGQLGLASSNTYLVARDHALLPRLAVNSIWVSIVLGLGAGVVTALAAFAADAFPTVSGGLIWYGVVLAPPTLFYLLGVNLLVGVGRIRAFNGVELGANALALVLTAGAALVGAGVAGFLGATIAAWTASAIVLALLVLRGARPAAAFDRAVFAGGWRYAAKAYVITLIGFLVLRSNVFLLQAFSGPQQLGYYSIAAQIGDVLAILPASVALVLFPGLVKDAPTRWPVMVRTAGVVAALVVLASAVTAVVAAPVIALLFGQAFAPAVAVLLYMLPGVVFLGVATIVAQYLGAIGLPRALIGVWVVVLACVVGLSLALTPTFGAAGSAAALSASYLVLLLLVAALALRHRAATR